MKKINAIKTALNNAKKINADLHCARNASDIPSGSIVGRTACGRLVYESEGKLSVLFADWLKLS